MSLLSVIVPCYNEEESVALFYQELTKNDPFFKEKEIELELLYIDDGSKDGTVREVKKLIEQDSRVHIVSFSRNIGKEAAMVAGLEKAKGDYVVMMDVELQDPPKFLGEMYRTLETGEYDCVAARRTDRAGERRIRSFFSAMFYKVINKISKIEFVEGARDYRLMTRKMRDAVLKMGEYNRFSKGLFSWVGFRTKWLSYHNVERAAGETKWSFGKLLRYSLDGIMGFSTLPLSLSSYGGIFFCGAAFLAIMFLVVRYLIWHVPVQGWTTLMCAMLLISGVQLLCVGILGQYLARIYLEVKNRPVYLLKETDEEETENEG